MSEPPEIVLAGPWEHIGAADLLHERYRPEPKDQAPVDWDDARRQDARNELCRQLNDETQDERQVFIWQLSI